jgi:hypothetical protein
MNRLMRPIGRRTLALWLTVLLAAPAAIATAYQERGAPAELSGHVTRADFRAVAGKGDRCRVELSPRARPLHECSLAVECGGAPVWGGSLGGGDARCLALDGEFTRARKRRVGLTWLWMNRDLGRMQVRDPRGYPIEIELD